MIKIMTVMALLLITAGNAYSSEKQCDIEKGRWRHIVDPYECLLIVDGKTTCAFGDLRMKFYDQHDKVLDVEDVLVREHIYRVIIEGICSDVQKVDIEYYTLKD